jgi:glycosyltransferase involved in cell wall biosynthesis
MQKLSSLSIFFPVYNDAKSIPYLVALADETARKYTSQYEILLINDGSADESDLICHHLAKTYSHVRYIDHVKNQGYGAVLQTGFRESRYDWVFYTDGDGQYDPRELSKLIKLLDRQTHIVNGYKLNRSDTFIRRFLGSSYNLFNHAVKNVPISDIDCDFRLIRTSKLRSLTLTSNSGFICVELITQLTAKKARFKEVGVHHYPRIHGTSQFFTLAHLLTTARDLWGSIQKKNNL